MEANQKGCDYKKKLLFQICQFYVHGKCAKARKDYHSPDYCKKSSANDP